MIPPGEGQSAPSRIRPDTNSRRSPLLIGERAYPAYYSGVMRSLWSRIVVGTWGIWLTTAFTGVAGTHMSGGAHDQHAAHSQRASPVEHAAHSHARGASQSSEVAVPSSDSAPLHYACMDQCCCGAPQAIVARAVALPLSAGVGALQRHYAEVATARIRWAHSQPFANGPPHSA